MPDPTPPAPAAAGPTTTIEPTIGRIVYLMRPHAEKPDPAMVIDVHPEPEAGPGTRVTVRSFGRTDGLFSGLPLYDAGKGPADELHCCWMPYQMGKAA